MATTLTNVRMPTHDSIQMIAILATDYAGATLFGLLLDRHAAISSDGEIFPTRRGSKGLCACGKAQVDCEYYRHVAGHMLEGDDRWNSDLFTRHPQYTRFRSLQRMLVSGWSLGARLNRVRWAVHRLAPTMLVTERAFVEAHKKLVSKSLQYKNARVYVDGTKDWRRAEIFAQTSGIEMKALHLVRDGRGFCTSYIKHHKLGKAGLSKAALAWMQHIRETDNFRARFPEVPFHVVRYEDVCRNYEETMEEVFSFAGVANDADLLTQLERPNHVIGNRMRMGFQGKITEDFSWKELLTSDEIQRISRQMRHCLRRFRYVEDS